MAAVVAAAGRGGAAQSERRAVRLHVAEALAVVALLSLRGPRQRASVRFMACIQSVVCCTKRPPVSVRDAYPVACLSRLVSMPCDAEEGMQEGMQSGRRLTVVAETLSRRADLGVVADMAALVAGTTRKRRHGDKILCSDG